MKSTRRVVLELLIKISADGAYSNIVVDNAFSKAKLTAVDRSFAVALFYGVLERQITLDYVIKQYTKTPFEKLTPEILQILRMGIYQLLYMNSVPESAAVNESVKLAVAVGRTSGKSFINAVLRSFIRDGKKLRIAETNPTAIMSLKYSCSEWLVNKWLSEYGKDKAEEILSSSLGRPPLYIRTNTVKIKTADLIQKLKKEKVSSEEVAGLADCLKISNIHGVEKLKAFRAGLFHVQDVSSQLCCRMVHPVFNETVIDLCAAPGGKSFTLAEIMGNRGKVLSFDLYDGRVLMVENGASRLGLTIITASMGDATVFNPEIPLADKVLCDVPCSGFGVIRRKPEIKYKEPDTLSDLPELQYKILCNGSKYVKPGGTLVYSTCTLSKAENDDVVDRFLNNNSDFNPIIIPNVLKQANNSHKVTIIPSETGGDGFFIATLRRKK